MSPGFDFEDFDINEMVTMDTLHSVELIFKQ